MSLGKGAFVISKSGWSPFQKRKINSYPLPNCLIPPRSSAASGGHQDDDNSNGGDG